MEEIEIIFETNLNVPLPVECSECNAGMSASKEIIVTQSSQNTVTSPIIQNIKVLPNMIPFSESKIFYPKIC